MSPVVSLSLTRVCTHTRTEWGGDTERGREGTSHGSFVSRVSLVPALSPSPSWPPAPLQWASGAARGGVSLWPAQPPWAAPHTWSGLCPRRPRGWSAPSPSAVGRVPLVVPSRKASQRGQTPRVVSSRSLRLLSASSRCHVTRAVPGSVGAAACPHACDLKRGFQARGAVGGRSRGHSGGPVLVPRCPRRRGAVPPL